MKTQSDIFVVTAPSGTGKTTLLRRLVKEFPHMRVTTSLTTRARRPDEKEGDHYWFVTREAFMEQVAKGAMLEWAEVFGHLYGTSSAEVTALLDRHQSPLLEIDVQGGLMVRSQWPQARAVLIMPPSVHGLWHRLTHRGTEDVAVRWRRLQAAKDELYLAKDTYPSFMINDDLEMAYRELSDFSVGQVPLKLSQDQGKQHCLQLLEEFDQAGWIKDLARIHGT